MGNNYVGYIDTKDPDLQGQNKYENMIKFADEILASLIGVRYGKNSTPLKVKIGIHCGKILSSLMGYKKVQFCLFGPTMNQTSRIASSDFATNQILISSQVWNKIEKLDLPYNKKKTQINVKGISETLTVYQISKKKNQNDHVFNDTAKQNNEIGQNVGKEKICKSEVSPNNYRKENNQLRKTKRRLTSRLNDENESNKAVKAWKNYSKIVMKESTELNCSNYKYDQTLEKKNNFLKDDFLKENVDGMNYQSSLMNKTKKETQKTLMIIEVFLLLEFIIKQAFRSDDKENNDIFSILSCLKMINLAILFVNNFLTKKLYESCKYRAFFMLNSIVLITCLVIETNIEKEKEIKNLILVETFFLAFLILGFPFYQSLELSILKIALFLSAFSSFYRMEDKLIEKILIGISSYIINIVKISIRHSFYQKSFKWSKNQSEEDQFTNNSIDHLLPKHVKKKKLK